MKKVKIADSVRIVGVKNFKGRYKMVDYYLEVSKDEKMYAFSKRYTQGAYEMCKSGIRLNELRTKKSRDKGIMYLVDYTNHMASFLSEYYELPA